MKKLLLTLGFVFTCNFAEAVYYGSFGGQRPALWRSSEVCVPINHVVLATSAVHIHSIRVTSATINNQLSSYNLFNATTSPVAGDGFAAYWATGTRVYPNVFSVQTVTNTVDQHWEPWIFDVRYSSGVVVNKIGLSCIETLWDFEIPDMDVNGPELEFVPWRP